MTFLFAAGFVYLGASPFEQRPRQYLERYYRHSNRRQCQGIVHMYCAYDFSALLNGGTGVDQHSDFFLLFLDSGYGKDSLLTLRHCWSCRTPSKIPYLKGKQIRVVLCLCHPFCGPYLSTKLIFPSQNHYRGEASSLNNSSAPFL